MSNHFQDAFVALLSERWSGQELPDEIDRDFRFMVFAAIEIYMTGRGTPPPRPLHEITKAITVETGLADTGRGIPRPRPLHPPQLFSAYGLLAMQREDYVPGDR